MALQLKRSIAHGPELLVAPGAPWVVQALAKRVQDCPDGLLRSYAPTGQHRIGSYLETWSRAARIAAGLVNCRGRDTGPVVLLIDDQIDFAASFWACLRAGYLAVPLGSVARSALHQRGRENLSEALDRLDKPTVVVDKHFAGAVEFIERRHRAACVSLDALDQCQDVVSEDCAQSDPLMLVPTSGSTGRVKLVALSPTAVFHRTFAVSGIGSRHIHHFLGTFPVDSTSNLESVFLHHRSWTHIPPAYLTARPLSIVDAIETFKISALSLSNSLAVSLVSAWEGTGHVADLSSLRWIGMGSEPVMREVVRKLDHLVARNGASAQPIRAGYGTTETGGLVMGSNPLSEGHEGVSVCLGHCLPGVALRIVDESNEILDEEKIGEVQVLTPQKIFSGYWGDEEATGHCFTSDGWWRTGDLGHMRQGEITLHGRVKEVVVFQGNKLSLIDIDLEMSKVLDTGDRAYSCAIFPAGQRAEQLVVAFHTGNPDPAHQREVAGRLSLVVERRFGLYVSTVLPIEEHIVPTTASGKLRRSELAAIVSSRLQGAVTDHPRDVTATDATSSISDRLETIWRDALNLDATADPTSSFFALGGDSLRALLLYNKIIDEFGLPIESDRFFADPTLKNLVNLVQSHPSSGPRGKDQDQAWVLAPRLRNRLLAVFETWQGERPTSSRLVIGYNTQGAKLPIFWVFNAPQEPPQLAAALGRDQPLYAFRSGGGVITYTEDEIQALALSYTIDIIGLFPNGTVFVGGNCQGAIIALAMAQHLLRRKRHIPLLVLMDWAFERQAYAGRVLFLAGRDNIHHNAQRRFARPDLAWRNDFASFKFVEISGGYAEGFLDPHVAELKRALVSSMDESLAAAPTRMPANACKATISADAPPRRLYVGERGKFRIAVKNASDVPWGRTENSALTLGLRWSNQQGDLINQIGEQAALPDMPAGASIDLDVPVVAPREPGSFLVHIDICEEGNRWLGLNPIPDFEFPVSVVARPPNRILRTLKALLRKVHRGGRGPKS